MTWEHEPKQGAVYQPPFSPPSGYMVAMDVFRNQVRVTINERMKSGKLNQVRRFWLSHEEFPGFLKSWYELGASAAMRRHSGRSEASLSNDVTGDILPEIESGQSSTGSEGGDTPTTTQLSLDLR